METAIESLRTVAHELITAARYLHGSKPLVAKVLLGDAHQYKCLADELQSQVDASRKAAVRA